MGGQAKQLPKRHKTNKTKQLPKRNKTNKTKQLPKTHIHREPKTEKPKPLKNPEMSRCDQNDGSSYSTGDTLLVNRVNLVTSHIKEKL